MMYLEQRVHRRLWLLRVGQALLAAVAGAVGLGLTAVAEGLSPTPLACIGAIMMAALVFLAARPWDPVVSAIDPAFDTDGLLRTAIDAKKTDSQDASLVVEAERRPLRFLALPDWQAWALLLLSASAAAGWALLEPEPMARTKALGQGNLSGLTLDGSLREEGASKDESAVGSTLFYEDSSQELKIGENQAETGQWQHATAVDDRSTLSLGLDLGLEQRVYERYLQNRAKNP